MTREQLMAAGSAALERQGARLAYFDDDSVSIDSGLGLRKRRLEVSLAPLVDWVAEHPTRAREGVASFMRGLAAVVLEPRQNRREARLTFAQAAGRLLPSLEGPLFAVGAALGLGEEPSALFGTAALDDLFVAHYLEQDTGRRLLTRQQVDSWGVSDDRTLKAALSVLFHRTYEVSPQSAGLDQVPRAQSFGVRDSYDGTRALILDTLLYQRALTGLIVAVPAQDRCLLLDEPVDAATRAAFRDEVETLHAQSAWPLSRDLYHVAAGPPVVLRD